MEFKRKTEDVDELIKSIKNGRFTLDGSGIKLLDDDRIFDLENKKLTSLEGCISFSRGSIYLGMNRLTNLIGSPKTGWGFFCIRNKLTSLEGAPEEIGGTFSCANNVYLSSLVGGPRKVMDHCYIDGCPLTSLKGVPEYIDKTLYAGRMHQYTDLHNIHHHIKHVSRIDFMGSSVKSHILGLLKINNLKDVKFDDDKLSKIINKYLPKGDVLDCQEELIEAGYPEYAQL